MEHLKIAWGPIRCLVCEPQVTAVGKSVGYGNLIRQVDQAVTASAFLGLRLYLVPSVRPLNRAVCDLESEQVRIIPQTHCVAWLLRGLWYVGAPLRYGAPVRWMMSRGAVWFRPRLHAVVVFARRRRMSRVLGTLDRWERSVRRVPQAHSEVVQARWRAVTAEARLRARRTGATRVPPRVRLRSDDEADACRLAAAAGIDLEKPLVTLHVRETGFLGQAGFRQRPFDRSRDADIRAYQPGVEALVARGVQVVRIGDGSMTPCRWPGVVDLATAPWRTDAFEIWAVLRSWFFIASDSGPYFLSRLARVPCLSVNVLQIGYYTRRADDRYICKLVRDNISGRTLTVREMLTEAFIAGALDEERYSWIENRPDDILEAIEDTVRLMHSDPKVRRPRTQAQRTHDTLMAELAGRVSGPRPRFGLQLRPPGPGSMSARFAERYLGGGD